MAEDPSPESTRYRIRREARGLAAALGRGHARAQALYDQAEARWRADPRFRKIVSVAAGLAVFLVLAWIVVIRSLPSADKLLDYQPPLPTMVRGYDGEIVYS